MKVVFICPSLNATSEKWLRRHVDMIDSDISSIITLYNADENKFKGIKVFSCNSSKLISRIFLLKFFFTLYRKIKCFFLVKNADVIFVEYMTIALQFDLQTNILSKTTKPIYIHVHGYDVTFDLKNYLGEKFHGPEYKPNAIELSKKSVIIANSLHTKQLLIQNDFKGSIVVKHLGVEDGLNLNTTKSKEFVALFVGRLVDFKGPDLVIEAFIKAKEMGMNGRLIMIGEGPLRTTCELLRIQSKFSLDIDLLGALDFEEIEKYKEIASIFISHNHVGRITGQQEAFGVSIIEAMAFRLPVIACQGGGVSEIVVHGETGYLSSPLDVDEQAKYLNKLSKDKILLDEMSNNGFERFRYKFTYQKEKELLKNILKL
jgi:glycosyltransferase involved in cell wall biosynthesis